MKKKIHLKSLHTIVIFSIISFLLIPQFSCSQSKAEGNLDGKNFTVMTVDKSKPDAVEPEHLSFMDGYFDSEECHQYGFTKTEYKATKDGDNINFEATMTSDKEGKMIWKGMVMGDKIHGDVVWKKDGQDDIAYSFESK